MSPRRPPQTAFEYAERGWRPALAWMIALPLGLFFTALLCLIIFALGKAIITGQPIPDLTGGFDRLLAPAWPYIAGGFGALFTLLVSRHSQVVNEIRSGGGQDRPPFDPMPPPSSDGEFQGVNPHGGPNAP